MSEKIVVEICEICNIAIDFTKDKIYSYKGKIYHNNCFDKHAIPRLKARADRLKIINKSKKSSK